MNSAHDLTEVQINNLIALGTAPKVEEHQIEALIVKEDFHQFEGTTLITCVLTLKNGYTVSGESACADPANFKEETGKALARKAAKNKIWALEGYVLKNKLAEGKILKETTHVERMVTELAELTDKAEKLSIFTETSRFMMLPLIERQDLHEQLHAMTIYQNVLCRRLERAQDKS